MGRALTALLLALSVSVCSSACSGGEALFFERQPLRGTLPAETALACLRTWVDAAGATVRQDDEPGAFRIELALPESAWTEEPVRVWRATADFGFDLRRLEAKACKLASALDHANSAVLSELDQDGFEEGQRGYIVEQSSIAVQLAEGETLPKGLRLLVRYFFAKLSPAANGKSAWRPFVGGHTGEGFPVPSGAHFEIEVDVFPGSYLRFFAVAEPLALGFDDLEECDVRFEVAYDDRVLFEHTDTARRLGGGAWHEIALPKEGKRNASLRFSVEAPLPCLAAFLSPSIGPATQVAETKDTRPDLMLVLLDTLRADALGFYGGDPEVAPRLNAFGEDCVRFERAWSNASWTLPSQSSMLSGLQPEQHGTVTATNSLPGSVVTLAEHLRAQGYRTGATTEALFIARRYGMDQGFDFFFENRRRKFKRTLEAADAFLGADDGRPTFFFLHTYRAHTPYRLGPEEDREPMRRFLADWEAWKAGPEQDMKSAIELGDRLRGLYYGGVSGLDVVLGPWLEQCEAEGFFERGYMILTSDHGESLQEHDVVGHGGRHWEERIRIPMFARGPSLTPGAIPDPVTLVDLAPTFTVLAGAAPHSSWVGSSMFQLQKGRVVFTFNSDANERAVTAHDLDHKVVAPMDADAIQAGRPMAVFDLASDPEENENLFKSPPAWATELLRAQASAIEFLMQPTVQAEEVDLTEEERAELKALGYTGDTED